MKKRNLAKAIALGLTLGMFAGAVILNTALAAEKTTVLPITFGKDTFVKLNLSSGSASRAFQPGEEASLNLGMKYWYNVLGKPANTPLINFTPTTKKGTDANASSDPDDGVTELANYFIDQEYSKNYAVGNINIEAGPWYFDRLTIIPSSTTSSYASTIVHEMFHALAVSCGVTAKFGSSNSVSIAGKSFVKYDAGVRDINNRELTKCTTVKLVKSKEEGAKESSTTFCILKDNWGGAYYTGTNVAAVLNKAKISWPDDSKLDAVPGIPLNSYEEDNNNDLELSHFELQNSLQSHQNYRNWAVPMEAELAVLQDLGFDISRKKFFGYSIYNSGKAGNLNAVTNTTGYNQSQDWGIGLHVYGSYNNVTQDANINASGAEAMGIRVDGTGNNITIASGKTVAANGAYGSAVNFTYGNGHTLTVSKNSTVQATGTNGRALSFDFGNNDLGNDDEYRGSYIWTSKGENVTDKTMLSALNGPLMNAVNINGNVIASNNGTAIYISPNALVKKININTGASIIGNIVDNWDKTASFVQLPTSGEDGMTALNFGDVAAFNMTYDGSISASNGNKATTLNMNVNNGNLTYTGTANVNSVTVAKGATLTGGTYTVNTFTNNGTITAITPVNGNTVMTITTNNGKGYSGNGAVIPSVYGKNVGTIVIDGNSRSTTTSGSTASRSLVKSVLLTATNHEDDSTATSNSTASRSMTKSKSLTAANDEDDGDEENTNVTVMLDKNGKYSLGTTYNLSDLVQLGDGYTMTYSDGDDDDNNNIEIGFLTGEYNSQNDTVEFFINDDVPYAALGVKAETAESVKSLFNALDEKYPEDEQYTANTLTENEAEQFDDFLFQDDEDDSTADRFSTIKSSSESLVGETSPIFIFSIQNSRIIPSVINSRLSGIKAGNAPVEIDSTNGLWFKFNKSWSGYNAGDATSNTSTLILGQDRQLNDNWRFGGFISYSDTSLTAKWADNKMGDYRIGIYSGFTKNNAEGLVYLNYGWERNNQKRSVGFVDGIGRGNANGQLLELGGAYKYDLTPASKVHVLPYAALQLSRYNQSAYTEEGLGLFNRHIENTVNNYAAAEFGFELRSNIKGGSLIANIGWKHLCAGYNPRMDFRFVSAPDRLNFVEASMDKNLFVAAISANTKLSDKLSLIGDISLEKGSNDKSLSAGIGLKYSF